MQSKAVVVGLSGGLGNQMFQYAAGRSLALRLGVPLTLDVSWFGGQAKRNFALNDFCIEAELWRHQKFMPKSWSALCSRFFRAMALRINGVSVFREPHFNYFPDFEFLSEPVFLDGYWQSERYFEKIRSVLIKDFSLKSEMPESCMTLRDKIYSCNSICVHVRRGDYLADPVAAKVHGICSLDYYRRGVQMLARGLDRAHCFVFSDDPSWVRQSFSLDYDMTVVDVNGSDVAHLDLILMASCDNFLIANSSLSWWAAWLGQVENKRVVAPARWFLAGNKNTDDLIPSKWIKL